MTPEPEEQTRGEPGGETPRWPLSPKMQIIVFVAGLGLFNCLLVAVFAAIFLLR